jgi:hypothetical protein
MLSLAPIERLLTMRSENCRRQNALGLEDSDTIALTTNLVAYWKDGEVHAGQRLRSLEPSDVLPFLRYNLHWRVLDVSYTSEVHLSDADARPSLVAASMIRRISNLSVYL